MPPALVTNLRSCVRWIHRVLNRDRANPVVHGSIVSLALAHDVDSFACGQTPICEACNHLVGAGTVRGRAAGNTGFEGNGPEKQSFGNGYRPISITDRATRITSSRSARRIAAIRTFTA